MTAGAHAVEGSAAHAEFGEDIGELEEGGASGGGHWLSPVRRACVSEGRVSASQRHLRRIWRLSWGFGVTQRFGSASSVTQARVIRDAGDAA
ncbi:hypothetical protein Srut_10870 [Streptomyces rutgersensis]|nr:hypothetical protein Srut_10870 [Streptomyces rutgersensis]